MLGAAARVEVLHLEMDLLPLHSISQGTLLDLKAITAEHVDKFSKEGRQATKGSKRTKAATLSRDPFDRPSPGLIKRLAAEARNDAKKRHFQDDPNGPSQDERRAILEAKARRYEQMSRGDYSGLTEKELAEAVIDFERKADEESEEESDEDESALPARRTWEDVGAEVHDDLERIEYVDEMGRSRIGTRKEAMEAEMAKRKSSKNAPAPPPAANSSYAEVLQSNVIHGEQNIFPVYQPDPEAIKAKYRAAEEEARAHHYDSTKEVRTRGAGAYQFSLDEEKRAEEMAALKEQRKETEKARVQTEQRRGMSAAQEMRKRKLDERRALVEAKRAKMLGGPEAVEKLRAEKRAKEADTFLEGLEAEMKREDSKDS